MRASRPTVVWVVAAVPVWPEALNLFVGAGFIPPAGVCAGAGCGGMGHPALRTPGWVAAVPVWPEAQNSFVGAGFIPPAGVCGATGCAGRCKHRPLQRFVVTRGYRFPGGRAFAVIRRGGFHIRPGRLRRRGVPGPIWNRPLQRFVVTPGYRFPGGRALAVIRRGGFHIRPRAFAPPRGARDDASIVPYRGLL